MDEMVAPLISDHLVNLSDSLEPQPALAVSWRHDTDFKRWEFQLRPGVKFHDGSPFTVALAAEALERLTAVAEANALVIRSERPAPRLLFELAGIPIWKRGAGQTVIGIGPFRLTANEWPRRVVFTANEDYWGGRPYLDAIEIETGRTLRDQFLDFEANKVDIIELGFGDARRPMQNGRKIWISPPVDLIAIEFGPSAGERVREAIALSIDRTTIHNVLLQKQGTPAASLLPQWLSGNAFLFTVVRDLERARQLGAGAAPVALAYDVRDLMARSIAERIAVNAREAGIVIRPIVAGAQAQNARIVRIRLGSPDPGQALASVNAALGPEKTAHDSPEAVYAAERALLKDRRIVPLFHVPEIYGLGPRVRGWAPSRWGGWKLESVWLAP